MTPINELTTTDFLAALETPGYAARTRKNSNLIQLMRCAHLNSVVGTLLAGGSKRLHKALRQRLRRNLKALGYDVTPLYPTC